jgi:hypothetical protein
MLPRFDVDPQWHRPELFRKATRSEAAATWRRRLVHTHREKENLWLSGECEGLLWTSADHCPRVSGGRGAPALSP